MRISVGFLSVMVSSWFSIAACGGDDGSDSCEGQAAPIAAKYLGVCAGQVKVCGDDGAWTEPDYTAITGYQADETTCDGLDNDCDGDVDEGGLDTFYLDHDHDTYGDPAVTITGCNGPPAGYVNDNTDCDDLVATTHPGADEVCDDVDNDCDETIDAGTCDANAHCDDSGTIACVCDEGFTGDGESCAAAAWQMVTTGGTWTYEGVSYGVIASSGHSCAIREGALYCWGNNAFGQLGLPVMANTPTRVGTDSDWTYVSAGRYHTCGIRAGNLYCWGSNHVRNYNWATGVLLGLGEDYDEIGYVDAPTLVSDTGTWTRVACGKQVSCAIDNGALYCWGYNPESNVDFLGGVDSDVPLQIGAETDWVELALSPARPVACGIRDDGSDHRRLWCWGDGSHHALGQGGSTGDEILPVQVPPLATADWTDWQMVSVGSQFACGIRDDGDASTLWCWGKNHGWGNLGDGTVAEAFAPEQIGTETDWEVVDAGRSSTCGIRGGDLYCWGRNQHSQLGLGDDLSGFTSCQGAVPSVYCTRPELADGDLAWSGLTAGSFHTCGIAGGALYCWGGNGSGEIGVGGGFEVTTPTAVE